MTLTTTARSIPRAARCYPRKTVPVGTLLRAFGELPLLPPDRPSLPELVLNELNAEAAQRAVTDDAHVALETGHRFVSSDVIAQHATQDAMLAGLCVVGRTPTGGAVYEKARYPDPSPAAAPEPAEAA